MISWFQSLTIGDTLMTIGFWLLGVLLLYVWAVFITKRLGVKRLPTVSLSQGGENRKKATASRYEGSKHQKRKSQFGVCRLLGSRCDIVKDKGVRYPADNSRDQQKQPTQCIQAKYLGALRIVIPKSHIATIVNKLRRRVNQSGKEPGSPFHKMQPTIRAHREWHPTESDER